jgi:hypothetical protein
MQHALVSTIRAAIVLTAVAALSATALALPQAAARPDDDPGPRQAREALALVEETLAASAPGSSAAPHGPRRDLTLALRDLRRVQQELPTHERARAERILARPASVPQQQCSAVACVHWESSGAHQADAAFASKVLDAVTTAHQTFVTRGYRAPLPDDGAGGNDLPDVYLEDLGGSVFGYATSDDPGWETSWGVSAYLVLDNDYAEFCGAGGCSTGLVDRFLKATAAHEYFHAVQFGYDWGEDGWFMEATATWAERLVYPSNRDNIAYLKGSRSPLTTPGSPMDRAGANPYGDWLFFEYLSERFGVASVRQAWEQADGWTGHDATLAPPDRYAIAAVRRVVSEQGVDWPAAWGHYAAVNRRPQTFYDDGRRYPSARLHGQSTLSKARRTRKPAVRLDHLAGATFRVVPARSLDRGWKLRVRLDGDPSRRGGAAVITYQKRGGAIRRVAVDLGADGRATRKVPFARATVRWVEVTVVNASSRFRDCWANDTGLSCSGVPLDDDRRTALTLTALRR